MSEPLLDEMDVRAELRRQVDAAGSQRLWAAKHGVIPAYVSDVLARTRAPPLKLLAELGFDRVIKYRKTR